jgi:hypothetical protein
MAPAAETSGWQQVDAGPFTLWMPAGYRRSQVQGIDSYVGRWGAGERRFVAFDWGRYSSTLDEARDLLQHGYAECRTEIGSHPAKLVSGYDTGGTWEGEGRKYVVAATWRDVQPGAHLTLTAASDRPEDFATLLATIRSVRFEPVTS